MENRFSPNAPTVSLSDTGYNAMSLQQKADLLQNIKQTVRNELLANRSTQHVMQDGRYGQTNSASMSQGMDYKKTSHKYANNREENCDE